MNHPKTPIGPQHAAFFAALAASTLKQRSKAKSKRKRLPGRRS